MSNLRMRRPLSKHFGVQGVVNGNRHRLILSGELDSATAGELEAVLLRVCGGGTAVVLDLSRLTSMDASGLPLLLLARSLCRERGAEFSIIPGQQNIRHLLEISGAPERIPLQSQASSRASTAREPGSAVTAVPNQGS